MPDKWDQFAVPATSGTDKWEQYAKPVNISSTAVDRPAAVDRFTSGVARTLNPYPGIKAIATDPQGLKHGIEQNVFEPQAAELRKAGEAARGTGEFSGMTPLERGVSVVGHGAAGALPMVGPAAAHAGESIGEGDVAGGLGEATGLGLGLATPDIARGVGNGLRRAAEPVAENALGIRPQDRAPAKAPGRAALDLTRGVRPETVRQSAGLKIADLSRLRDAAIQRGGAGIDLGPTRDIVTDAIRRAAAGNSETGHLARMNEQLNEPEPGFAGQTNYPPGSHQPVNFIAPYGQSQMFKTGPAPMLKISDIQTPESALAMRQRFGNDFTKFDTARPLSREALKVGNRAYGQLTGDIHRAVPESAAPDTAISNLIPVRDSARFQELQPGLGAKALQRFGRHTGALAGAALGMHEAGIPGAVAGLVVPELLADPTVQMTTARALNAAGTWLRKPIGGRIVQTFPVAALATADRKEAGR